MALISWAATAPTVKHFSRLHRGARPETSIGFRSAQNAPPYGLRWAPLQPTLVSGRRERRKRNRESNEASSQCEIEAKLCSEHRPTRVLQKAAIFTC